MSPTILLPQLGLSASAELPAQQLGWTAYQTALNVDLTQGAARKRGGFASWIPGLTGIPLGLWRYELLSGQVLTVIATTQRVYSYNPVTQAVTDRTPPGYSGTPAQPPAFAVLNGIAALTTDGGFWSWDGAAATFAQMPAGSPKSGWDLASYGNHLLLAHPMLANGTVDPFAMMWSDYLNPTVWTSGDAGTIDIPDGGDAVMAVRLLGQSAVLLKEDSIYQITTVQSPLFYALSRVADFTGTVAPQSVREIPGLGLAFLGRNDVYTFGGMSAPAPLLGGHGETLRRMIVRTINQTYASAAFAISDIAERRYLVFVPTSAFYPGRPDYACYVHNWAYGTWAQYDFPGLPGGVCGGGEGTTDVLNQVAPRLVLGSQVPAALHYQPDPPIGIDTGGGFRSTVTTGLSDLSGGDPKAIYSRHKTVRRLALVSSAGSLGGVYVSVLASDNGVDTRTIGPLSLPLRGALPATCWPDVTAVWAALQFDDGGSGWPFEWQTVYVDIEVAGDR